MINAGLNDLVFDRLQESEIAELTHDFLKKIKMLYPQASVAITQIHTLAVTQRVLDTVNGNIEKICSQINVKYLRYGGNSESVIRKFGKLEHDELHLNSSGSWALNSALINYFDTLESKPNSYRKVS